MTVLFLAILSSKLDVSRMLAEQLGLRDNRLQAMVEDARQLTFPDQYFDRVISVAEAGSFKPHVATYTKAAELLDLAMDQILFVANHAFDCIGAKAAGMRTAFIDRRSRPFGETPHQPDILVPTMKDLAELIV